MTSAFLKTEQGEPAALMTVTAIEVAVKLRCAAVLHHSVNIFFFTFACSFRPIHERSLNRPPKWWQRSARRRRFAHLQARVQPSAFFFLIVSIPLLIRSTPGQRVGHVAVVLSLSTRSFYRHIQLLASRFFLSLWRPTAFGTCASGSKIKKMTSCGPELDGWLRVHPERACAREQWRRSLLFKFEFQGAKCDELSRLEDIVKVDGVYSMEVAAALQVRVLVMGPSLRFCVYVNNLPCPSDSLVPGMTEITAE
jgi:hypothetical protein